MPIDTPEGWRRRFEAITRAMEETQALAANTLAARRAAAEALHGQLEPHAVYALLHETQQTRACSQMLQALRDFAEEAFTFFMTGYYDTRSLPVSSNCPPRTVMRTLLNQISFDLSIVQRAINQRWRLDAALTQQGRALLMADRLAESAVAHAVHAGLVPASTTAVCYLDQQIRARLVPYADALFVSIPFSSLQEHDQPARDFLAIPHEIGHHVYWNGRLPTAEPIHQALTAALHAADAWTLRWLEELFADAFALVVGGPAVALDFQEMLGDDAPLHFRTDTDKHPIPALRPFIHTTILRRLTGPRGDPLYPAAADRLDASWRRWLGRDALAQPFDIHGAAAPLSGHAVLAALDKPITQVLDLLQRRAGRGRPAAWSGDLKPKASLAQLYTQYHRLAYPRADDRLGRMLLHQFKAELHGETADARTQAYFARYAPREVSFFEALANLTGQAIDTWSTGSWVQQFLHQGWSDEGPQGDPGGWTTSGSGPGLTADSGGGEAGG